MFQSKNISPSILSAGISVCIAAVVGISMYIANANLNASLGMFAGIGLFSYLLIYYSIERFIYRKIKLIYKLISQTKATKREEFFNQEILPPKTIDEVSQEVANWAEAKKIEVEKLQSNEAFRREFLTNLAHELKTPIFSAQGFIETLLNGAIHDEKVNTEFLQKAAKSLERLSDLIADVNEISNLESNQLSIRKTEFVIQELIRDVFEELNLKAKKKGISLSIKQGCEQDIRVLGDKNRIKQVLINLVENSITYGNEQGYTSSGIYIVDESKVLVEINDNGIGIAEEQIPRVFERFYRTDAARSRNQGGSGLGLAIVKHIVEAHGQNVFCRSTPDVGTTFGFSLERFNAN